LTSFLRKKVNNKSDEYIGRREKGGSVERPTNDQKVVLSPGVKPDIDQAASQRARTVPKGTEPPARSVIWPRQVSSLRTPQKHGRNAEGFEVENGKKRKTTLTHRLCPKGND